MSDVARKDAFRDYLFSAVEDVGATLEPDDDWAPVMMLIGPEKALFVPLIDGEGNDLTHDLPTLTALIAKESPQLVGRVGMGWASTDLRDQRPVSEREDREEVLVVQIAEAGSRQEVWIGKVQRHPDAPPEVTSWEKSDSTGGVMVEAIQAAMEHTHRSN